MKVSSCFYSQLRLTDVLRMELWHRHSHKFHLKMAETNYVRSWRRASVRTRCVSLKVPIDRQVCAENCFAQVIS